jgi:hypothetical protein
MSTSSYSVLRSYITADLIVDLDDQNILNCPISTSSTAIEANSYYFGHPEWAKNYFENCHRDQAFKSCYGELG